jgi:16S rRNA (uracil1498-N3)-methyltransferase
MDGIGQYYYQKDILTVEGEYITLDESVSHHICTVLRASLSHQFSLIDGVGGLYQCALHESHKKHATAKVLSYASFTPFTAMPSLAIAFTKQAVRMEWLLEKACEIGVSHIYPIITARSESVHFKYERWNNILISAACQSKKILLPQLHEPIKFSEVLKLQYQFLIAHCNSSDHKKNIPDLKINSPLILIGPEGDFTEDEVSLCVQNKGIEISLGETRLRTETAALSALVLANAQFLK